MNFDHDIVPTGDIPTFLIEHLIHEAIASPTLIGTLCSTCKTFHFLMKSYAVTHIDTDDRRIARTVFNRTVNHGISMSITWTEQNTWKLEKTKYTYGKQDWSLTVVCFGDGVLVTALVDTFRGSSNSYTVSYDVDQSGYIASVLNDPTCDLKTVAVCLNLLKWSPVYDIEVSDSDAWCRFCTDYHRIDGYVCDVDDPTVDVLDFNLTYHCGGGIFNHDHVHDEYDQEWLLGVRDLIHSFF